MLDKSALMHLANISGLNLPSNKHDSCLKILNQQISSIEQLPDTPFHPNDASNPCSMRLDVAEYAEQVDINTWLKLSARPISNHTYQIPKLLD